MLKADIKGLQTSALSKINFCFYELKKNPPLQWENKVIDNESLENSKDNFTKLNSIQQALFKIELFQYLDRESTTEARIMLIINYLVALLVKGENNEISIHKNFNDNIKEIEDFENNNKSLLQRLKTARNKLYAHVDLNWQSYAKGIMFDEFEICINFLNKLFDYRFEVIKENAI